VVGSGPPTNPVPATDQRGLPRVGAPDIGTFEVQSGGAPTITLSPSTLPTGTVGTAYSQTIAASGGTAPYTFTVTAGTLPNGLTLNPTTGILSGTPTTAATYTFTVTAKDANTVTGSQSYSVTISPAAAPTLVSITLTGPNSTPPPATLKVGQMAPITATGAYSSGPPQNLTTQVQWSSTNPNIAKVDAMGTVTGESPGTATITATLNGVTQSFTVTVVAPTPIGITVQPAPTSRASGASVAPGSSAPAAVPAGR